MSVHRPITAGALVALSLTALALTAPRIAPVEHPGVGPAVTQPAPRSTTPSDVSGATASGPGTGAGPGAGAHARASAHGSPEAGPHAKAAVLATLDGPGT